MHSVLLEGVSRQDRATNVSLVQYRVKGWSSQQKMIIYAQETPKILRISEAAVG